MLALSAACLVIRTALACPRQHAWRIAALAGVAAIVNLTRQALVGKELSPVLLAYKVDTWAVLALAGLVLTLPPAAAASQVQAPADGFAAGIQAA